MKNAIVAQSGGPTAVINGSLLGVCRAAMQNEAIGTVYGGINGIQGIMEERFVDMGKVLNTQEKQDMLAVTPASFLGSCRFKLGKSEEEYAKVFAIFKQYNIGYFFYIGGNDSMDTVDKLSKYAGKIGSDIKIMGVPKTIDNDLKSTDHTPGFGSAAKYIATTIREIGIDCEVYDLYSVTIVEIMGRNAGWLAASSALARDEQFAAPHLIYLPEAPFSAQQFISDIKKLHENGTTNVVVAASEGIKFADGTFVCESASSGLTDIFGHKNLSGTAKVMENMVREEIGCKARGIELNLPQRCAAHLVSKTDLDEAIMVGDRAVAAAVDGTSGKMMAYHRISDIPYEIEIRPMDISEIANGEKVVPPAYISDEGNDITVEMMTYLRPLIQGQSTLTYKDGLPQYLKLDK